MRHPPVHGERVVVQVSKLELEYVHVTAAAAAGLVWFGLVAYAVTHFLEISIIDIFILAFVSRIHFLIYIEIHIILTCCSAKVRNRRDNFTRRCRDSSASRLMQIDERWIK